MHLYSGRYDGRPHRHGLHEPGITLERGDALAKPDQQEQMHDRPGEPGQPAS
jgi:hypothetical protein